jgi:hypothetical protein
LPYAIWLKAESPGVLIAIEVEYNQRMKETYERLGIIPFLALAAGLVVLSLLTLDHIVNNFYPFDVQRLDLLRATALDQIDAPAILEAPNLEFVLVFLGVVGMAVTGIMLPVAYFFNWRFARDQKAPRFLTVLRQAMWAGLWVAFCTWLQMNRVLGVAVATLVGLVFVLFEVLLQLRTRAAGGDG